MDDGWVPEFEGTVDQRYVVRVVLREQVYRYLQIPEYFMSCFF